MFNLALSLKEADIYYELYQHRKIFSNEDALVVKAEQGFSGTETKSLFLKNKKQHYFIFLTFMTKQTDFKKLQRLTGQRLKIVDSVEMEQLTGQKPGAVSPFGYDPSVAIIIDEELLDQEKLVFAPGRPDQTMVILGKDLPAIINLFKNKSYIYPKESNECQKF
ncbi:YbaK/EbsC family protein [Tetragenococcus solitarius]|uniref:YbaK/EbsC family protein n=1 Tax=Tetragenococcus solitarius TaxID=71453 RepID=A0ABN3Y899_9ENTE|nr:YbaK/EbsC family protein [Tetragenococcus solitarius]